MITADIKDYASRVAAGKVKEEMILNALRNVGLTIQDPTPAEDMHDKIDGWIVDKNGNRHALQIKYRDNGDDILVEIIKDLDKKIVGRDMEGKAEFLCVVNSHGYARLFKVDAIKRFAAKVEELVKKGLEAKADRTNWKGTKGWEAKVTVDKAHGNRKLMGYFSPSLFPAIGEWQFKF